MVQRLQASIKYIKMQSHNINLFLNFRYKINNIELQYCILMKDLGIKFDEKMSFPTHIADYIQGKNLRVSLLGFLYFI